MKFKILTLAAFLFASSVFSYSYNAFSISTGEKTLILNPYFAADGLGGYANELFLAYGVTDKIDIWSDINMYPSNGMISVDFSTMVRYDIGKSNIIACRFGPKYVSPQYHLTLENDAFAFQANIVAQVSYDHYKDPAFYGILCPVVKLFGGNMDIFCEVNPGYYMFNLDIANLWPRPEGFGLDIVPGIGFAIKDALFSVSCPIYDVTNDASPTFGMWWALPIKFN